MALACTHFPLLTAELNAAAPRACAWLDSGEAIARRVAAVLNVGQGEARVRRAGFTDAEGARDLEGAFVARGFAEFARIGVEPSFDVTPITNMARH